MDHQTDSTVIEKEDVQDDVAEPPLYKVILHNDDYTPMEFVVEVLMNVFRKSETQATELMLAVHHEGQAVAGIYPLEIAETKVNKVLIAARKNEYPLQLTMEKD